MTTKRATQNDRNAVAVDRISELPDHIIHHILSFIPTVEAVQTSLLSKRWRRMWYSVPALHFSQFSIGRNFCQRRFQRFVSECLIRRERDLLNAGISRFKLSVHGNRFRTANLDTLVNFVAGTNVKELDVSIKPITPFQFISMPQAIFSLSSLTLLRLRGVRLKGLHRVNLPFLLSLSLEGVQMDDQRLHNILAGCCSLEKLLLKKCVGLLKPKVLNSSLQSLEIVCGSPRAIFQVEVPNLQTFVFDGGRNNSDFSFSSWETIQELSLSKVNFDDWWLEHLIVRLPLLESLALYMCPNFVQFKICCPHLKHFVLQAKGFHGLLATIDTPNLLSFSFEGYLPDFTITTSNVSKANIKLYGPKTYNGLWYNKLLNFLTRINGAKDLTLHVYSEEALVFPIEFRRFSCSPLPTLKHLKVVTNRPLSRNSRLRDALLWLSPSATVLTEQNVVPSLFSINFNRQT